jgi:hypothetical protein
MQQQNNIVMQPVSKQLFGKHVALFLNNQLLRSAYLNPSFHMSRISNDVHIPPASKPVDTGEGRETF